MKRLAALIAAGSCLLSGCMITKMSVSPKWNPNSAPAYVDNTDHWWWGLDGSEEYSLQKICVDQKPHAFERRRSAEDGIIALLTLGVYAPSTLRVWCGD